MFQYLTRLSAIGLCTTLAMPLAVQADYSKHSKAKALVNEMVSQHGFDEKALTAVMKQANKRKDIIKLMTRPAEGKAWHAYRKIFLTDKRIKGGAKFWHENHEALAAIEKHYGVAPEIVVAIIGVETFYGGNTGHHRVIDALSTLAFDYPKRSKFFTSELKHFLLLTREEDMDPTIPKGSYAGAMGLGQFMPSSFRSYAVDGDKDEKRDIWHNRTDAIFSVANYFKRHGWKANQPVAYRARLGKAGDKGLVQKSLKPKRSLGEFKRLGATPITSDGKPLAGAQKATLLALKGANGTEHWIGLHNFYVITRYNHSHKYAMAIHQLSQAILARYVSGVAE